jgi:serine/threonine-protein kinase
MSQETSIKPPEDRHCHTVMFCQGCNEKVAVRPVDRHCPLCGETLSPLQDAPTADFSDLAARGTYVGSYPEQSSEVDRLIGKRVSKYSIEAFLGKGGMARVYRATHLMLERPCAIKVLNPLLVQRNPDYVKMFFAEARAAASLVHPHVVTIHTIDHDDGLHLIEMEYVVGQSLQRMVESRKRLEPIEALAVMVQIASALAEAHRFGMVHRDIKPANVLVTESGVAKLSDFGLAKRVARSGAATSEPLAGTPYFMAPELFEGQHANSASDVYAMGVTFYFLLTGHYPFVEHTVTELARMHYESPIPDIRQAVTEVSEQVATIVTRCLSKSPQDRYADASQLHGELLAAYRGLRSLESLVREALAHSSAPWQGQGNRFETVVPLANGRKQRVIVEAGCKPPLADQIVRIYSPCAPATEGYYRSALELNAALSHGAIGIEPVDGQLYFVMGNAYPRSTCDPEEIRRSVLEIARHADQTERLLTGRDQY